jgi:hypothetical protein
MLPVDEGVFEPQQMVVVILVKLGVKLQDRISFPSFSPPGAMGRTKSRTDTSIML